MMSLQTSTHSSQIKTVGPAISLRTSFWSLLQNEQRRISVSPFFLTIFRSDDVVADFDTLVADKDRRTRNQLADVVLVFVAERAAKNLGLAVLLDHIQI